MGKKVKKRILASLLKGTVKQPVVWIPIVGVTVEMMKISGCIWPEVHSNSKKMAKLASMTYHLTGVACTTIPFCLTLEAEALGARVNMGRIDRNPYVVEPVEKLLVPDDLLERGRIPVLLEALQLLREYEGHNQPINVKVTGPFTIACQTIGTERFLKALIKSPDFAMDILEKTTQVSLELSLASIRSGADVITISDPNSSGDIIGPEQYRKFIFPHHQGLFGNIDSPTVLHICGNTRRHLPLIAETGVDGFSFEEKVDPEYAMSCIGSKVTLIGNVPTVDVLLDGSPEDVRNYVEHLKKVGIPIISSGCTISPLTPLENLKAMSGCS